MTLIPKVSRSTLSCLGEVCLKPVKPKSHDDNKKERREPYRKTFNRRIADAHPDRRTSILQFR